MFLQIVSCCIALFFVKWQFSRIFLPVSFAFNIKKKIIKTVAFDHAPPRALLGPGAKEVRTLGDYIKIVIVIIAVIVKSFVIALTGSGL